MKKLLVGLVGITLLTSGCGLMSEQENDYEDGFWKISFVANVDVYNDASIPEVSGGGPVACFADGHVSSVMYFNADGGDVIKQDSSVTMDNVSCIECVSEIVSESADVEIGLLATFDPDGSSILGDWGSRSTNGTLKVWMDQPLIYPVDILYTCPTGTPGVSSDYGAYLSQIVSPYLTEVHEISLTPDGVTNSTREGFSFPPTYLADIEYQIIEEFIDSSTSEYQDIKDYTDLIK